MTKESCGLLILIVGGLAFAVYTFSMVHYLMPRVLFGGSPRASSEQRRKIVAEVRASGESLASKSFSLQVAGYAYRRSFMLVDIRPGGIIVNPLYGRSAVRADEITQLRYEKGFLRGGLYIVHTSPAMFSPIFLAGLDKHSAFARTLESIIPANSEPASLQIQF